MDAVAAAPHGPGCRRMHCSFIMDLGITHRPRPTTESKALDESLYKATPMAAAQAPSPGRRLSGRLCQWKHYLDRFVRH